MRLDKFLSNLKYGSRKDVKKIIKNGFVKINDVIIKDDDYNLNLEKDEINVFDKPVFYKENITLMMNKPKGYLSSNYDKFDKTVIDLLKEPYNRFDYCICGRLDKDTTGLIILTTDSKLQHLITNPNKDIKKKYLVKTLKKVTKKDLEILKNGVDINVDGKIYHTLNADYTIVDDYNFYLEISEGKFHQVKKMVNKINNEVIELKRVSIGNINLDSNLKEGEYKEINWQ